MKINLKLLVLAISLIASIAQAESDVNDTGRVITTAGPRWTFLEGKKNSIPLPEGDQIIFGSRLVPFEKWNSTYRDSLLLSPGYVEPTLKSHEDPKAEAKEKKLEVLEVRVAFTVNQPLEKFSKEAILQKSFIDKMDETFVHSTISAAQLEPSGDAVVDGMGWCGDKNKICVESHFKFSGSVAKGLYGAWAKDGRKTPSPTEIMFQSEFSYLDDAGSAPLKVYNGEARALMQKTFYINHFFQYATTNVVFHKLDEKRTLVVVLSSIGIQADVLAKEVQMGPAHIVARKLIYEGAGLSKEAVEELGLKGVELGLIPYSKSIGERLSNFLNNM